MSRPSLAQLADFRLGPLTVCPSACRIVAEGMEVRVEAQTMAVLVALAEADGATVTRETLINACWDGRVVSDDAVARTIAKVRSLARGANPVPFTLQTIPKVGYRLIASKPSEEAPTAAANAGETAVALRPQHAGGQRSWKPFALAAAGIIGIMLVWGALPKTPMSSLAHATGAPVMPGPSAAEVSDALWTLNEPRLQQYLQRGWDVNWPLDSEGSAALHILLLVCERNRTHDQAGLTRIAQFLVASGANPATPNKWGDTPLIIASAPKYCGPDHPVVKFLRAATAVAPRKN
jgi:DNA-binding winged helix-turn-helix (wHTH) protein